MGSDLYMDARWRGSDYGRKVETGEVESLKDDKDYGPTQEERLAQRHFKEWYGRVISEKDNPWKILDGWMAFWEGYNYHKNLSTRV